MSSALQRSTPVGEAAASGFAGDRILTWRWPWLYEALFRLSPTSRRVRGSEIDAVLEPSTR